MLVRSRSNKRIETASERVLATYREQLRAMKSDEVDLLSVEEGIVTRLKAIGAEMMAEAMKRADTDAAEILVDGERCGSRRTSRGSYQTVFGEVVIERSVYQQAGRGRLRIPMDLRLGIEEGAYTPKLTRILTRGVRRFIEMIARVMATHAPSSSLDLRRRTHRHFAIRSRSRKASRMKPESVFG